LESEKTLLTYCGATNKVAMKISLPSISAIWESASKTFLRFPFVILSSITGSIAVVWLINQSGATDILEAKVFSLAFVGFLGISWMYAITVFFEQLKEKAIASWPFMIAAAIGLIGYYLYLDTILIDARDEVWYQLFLFFLITHLFAAFAPFVISRSVDQFWEYNKTLFLRFLLSGVYSAVLFIGLSVAMLALDNLLEINIDEEFYPSLFIIIAGVFNTWFFLAGLPSQDEIPIKKIQYPTGLKVFVQYVLISLVTVYIVILYAYLIKIILQWELPNGWVANLVLSFSIAGILSLLLLYPIKEGDGNKWIQLFSKWYYRALIPLVVLLFVSIWVRISEYGVTINRFFVATLGVWLTFIVIYFIFSKVKSIKVVPISLAVFVLFTAVGPFSAFNASERSQLGRLLEFTQSGDMLNSKEEMQSLDLSNEAILEINSIVEYLVNSHGKESIESIIDEDRRQLMADSLDENRGYTTNRFIVEELIGVSWQNSNSYVNEDGSQNYAYSSTNRGEVNISEYDYFLGSYKFHSSDMRYTLTIDEREFEFGFDRDSLKFDLESDQLDYEIPFAKSISEWHSNNKGDWYNSSINPSDLQIEADFADFNILLLVDYIAGNTGPEDSITNITVQVFVN
jgi:hypothetical protein